MTLYFVVMGGFASLFFNPFELVYIIPLAGVVLAFIAIASSFVVAFYLVCFGLPVALILGDRIRHPAALGLSLLDAVLATVIAVGGWHAGIELLDAENWTIILLVLGFALPAGYLYRRNLIALRDEWEAIDLM